MMGLVTLSGGHFGAILESWGWFKAALIVVSVVRKTFPIHLLRLTQYCRLLFYVFGHANINIYFHPLAKFPAKVRCHVERKLKSRLDLHA